MTAQKNIIVKLERALEMLVQHPRMKAATRNDVTTTINSAIADVLAIPASDDKSDLVIALEAKVKELTSLVEQQASYIHNNIKPAPTKGTAIPFLSKEQPDAGFGVYTVNPEWLKQRVGNGTVTNQMVENAVREEANILAQKQLNTSSYQIQIIITSALSVRFSIRQGGAFQGVNRLMGNNLFPGIMNPVDLAKWLDAARQGGGMF